MRKISGIGLSTGIAIGKARILENYFFMVPEYSISKSKVDSEITRFIEAIRATEKEIIELQKELNKNAGKQYADIFSFHLSLLNDNFLIEKTKNIIMEEGINTESALKTVLESTIQEFGKSSDDLMKDRRRDLADVIEKIIAKLKKSPHGTTGKMRNEIIVARDLAPSQTVSLNKRHVIGFVTEIGSITSHTAILAKALEIPAIVANESVTETLKNGDLLIIDAEEGIIIQNPPASVVEKYGRKKEELLSRKRKLSVLKNLKGSTRDGKEIKLHANIEFPEEIETARKYGAEGIGLYRTEYFFLNRKDLPCEEEQFLAFKKVCDRIPGKSIIIRTLDIGGDKFLSELPYPRELNPFLGWRGIRFCLERKDIFETQLRAILRASVSGNLKIMFPMVSTLEEIQQIKEVLAGVKNGLKKEKKPFNPDIEMGIMIEIPSAALISERLAEEVDFFSIGSNDLVQYTLAVDRGNAKISHLYQPCHPAVLKLVQMTIENGRKAGIWTGICGEMASIPEIACLLAGFGAEELSMAPVAIPSVKEKLREMDYPKLKEIAAKTALFDNHDAVFSYIQKNLK
ncbi:MAG TPA: phosphoenolpyruvate--protein phosphotransferase [bacterium]|nr:phosphoenolpyruvate--protein phosphotransferase [bacterium]